MAFSCCGPVAPYPRNRTIHAVFEEQAARRPDAVALCDGEAALRYRELDERANQLAHYLRDRGARPGLPIAVCMERSLDFVVAVLAILKAGSAYLPFSPDLPPRRIQFILEDMAAPLLITHRGRIKEPPVAGVSVLQFDADAQTFSSYPKTAPPETASPEGLACILFTSGSTGKPKGVEIVHRGVLQLLFGADYVPLHEEHVFLLLASVSFDVSMFELWGALLHGARCVIYPDGDLDFHRLGSVIREENVTCMWLTSTLFNSLIDLQPELLSGVSYLLTGGEALSVPHVYRALKALPSTQIINGYGPAESTVFTSTYAIPRDFPPDARSVPIGRPIANTHVYILDPAMEPVPEGETGELYVGKENLARGYHARPELTAERFLPDPFCGEPGARMYKSGDRCRWLPGGAIEFIGRFDSQVKMRGFRIELGEIEWVLGQHPSVRQCAVCAPGEGTAKRLFAYVKPDERTPPSVNSLRTHLGEHLPEYMIPGAIQFLDAFPLTTSGKIDRQSLGERAISEAEAAPRHVLPETDTERILAGIWAEVFRLEEVGIEDNFFNLGGNSLKAAFVLARVSQACKVNLVHRQLFESPTIRQLARCIDAAPEALDDGALPRIERRLEEAPAPLSSEQEGIWFTVQVTPDAPLFNEQFTIRTKGAVDAAALKQALNDLVRRHEILRTVFVLRDGTPAQVVQDDVDVPLDTVTMQELPAAQREAEVVRLASAETRRMFRLDTPPLFRALLVQVSEDDARLYLVMHHIITDAWTFYDVMAPELWALYEARRTGTAPALENLPIQFGDYAHWQRRRMQVPLFEKHLQEWKARLEGAQELALIPDHARPAIPSCRGAFEHRTISPELTDKLRALAHRENATLFMVLLAGFKALMGRHTQQNDIVIGTAIDCRDLPELEALAGCFVRIAPIRTNLAGNPTFLELVHRVREVTLAAYEAKDVPFSALVRELNASANPYRPPLLRVACVMEPGVPEYAFDWSPLQVEIQGGASKFDLLLEFEEREGGVLVRLERDTELYEATTVTRMFDQFVRLLGRATEDPGQRLAEIALLTDEERLVLLREFAHSPRPYPRDDTIHGVFERQASARGSAVAVIDGEVALTYEDLNRRASQLAHYLRGLGVEQDLPVAVCMDRSWEFIVAALGILKAGGAYLPIDPALPTQRMQFLLEDAGASLMLVHRGYGSDLSVPHLTVVSLPNISGETKALPESGPPEAAAAEKLAYIMYTSGSTGEPKGVEIPHRGVLRLLCGVDYVPLDASQTFLLLAPLGFDASTFELWAPLLHGGRCVVYPDSAISLTELERIIIRNRVTCLWLTAALFNTVIDIRPQILVPISYLLTGGEALSVNHVRRALAQLPDTHLINGYGPTESTTFTCTHPIPRELPEKLSSIPIGRPVANTRVYILDPGGEPVPVGVPGELHVGGDGLAVGYRNRPALTAERFVPDPFPDEPGARMYKTGDRCRWLADGSIEFLGRFDRQVKLRGFRVELGEIEAVLAHHPSVSQCAVALPGESSARQLVAYVVTSSGNESSVGDLRAFLSGCLPAHMVPARFLFLDAMPLTPNGKIDWDGLPAPSDAERPYLAPKTDTERALAAIWKEVLKKERIGREDNFFDLGGHSLKALAIAVAIERQFRRVLSLAHLFTAPTIAQLAAVLDGDAPRETTGKAILIAGSGPQAPLFCIPGVGGTVFSFREIAVEVGRDRPVYGLQYPGIGDGETLLATVEGVAEELVRRMLDVEPEGPYHLLGYSLGGAVAFEVARKLRAGQRQVAMLGLIDCPAPSALVQRPLRERIRMHLDALAPLGPRAKAGYLLERLLGLLRGPMKAEPLVPLGDDAISIERLRRVQEHMDKAGRRYVPGIYPGRAVLFRAVQPTWTKFTVMDSQMGWGPLVQGGVDVRSIPGRHLEVFEKPNVNILIPILKTCLEAADSDAVKKSLETD